MIREMKEGKKKLYVVVIRSLNIINIFYQQCSQLFYVVRPEYDKWPTF
jgi:hypothetical protein